MVKVTMIARQMTKLGRWYDCYVDGEYLCNGYTDPEHMAIRALKAQGVTGLVEFWDDVLPFARSSVVLGVCTPPKTGLDDTSGYLDAPEPFEAVLEGVQP